MSIEPDNQDELITDAINNITQKLGDLLLKEFLDLPDDLQINLILIKSSQLLLANILCQVASNKKELSKITEDQATELKDLTLTCAFTAFSNKFEGSRH